MANKINTNINALNAQIAGKQFERKLENTMLKLSTGSRINRAGDDPAGIAVSTKFKSQIIGSNMASNNIQDAIAMIQTTDGVLGEISNLMQRMRELAVQSSTDTYISSDRQDMDTEYQQLEAEIIRIVDQTKWNKMNTLNGAGPSNAATDGEFIIQLGSDNGQSITIELGNFKVDSTQSYHLLSDLDGLSLLAQASASAAITSIDNAFIDLAIKRSDFGAYMNRLEHALSNSEIFNSNMSDSNSRIEDTDFGVELAELAKYQILKQAGQAMLTQANAIPNQVLGLLQ